MLVSVSLRHLYFKQNFPEENISQPTALGKSLAFEDSFHAAFLKLRMLLSENS